MSETFTETTRKVQSGLSMFRTEHPGLNNQSRNRLSMTKVVPASSPAPGPAFRLLGKKVSKLGIVFIFVSMMYAYMSRSCNMCL